MHKRRVGRRAFTTLHALHSGRYVNDLYPQISRSGPSVIRSEIVLPIDILWVLESRLIHITRNVYIPMLRCFQNGNRLAITKCNILASSGAVILIRTCAINESMS